MRRLRLFRELDQILLRALQLAPGPVREGLGSLGFWAGDPVGFLAMVYGTEGGGWSWVRAVGWLLIAAGGAVAWRDRHPTPRLALLRFMTVAVTCQVLLLWLVARDMHHLAQATPTLALTAGLSLDALAGTISPRGGPRRALIALALTLWPLAARRVTAVKTYSLAVVPAAAIAAFAPRWLS